MSQNEGSPRKGGKPVSTKLKGGVLQDETTTMSGKKKTSSSADSVDSSKIGNSSKMVVLKSPMKKPVIIESKGGVTLPEGKELLNKREKDKVGQSNKQRKDKIAGTKQENTKNGDLTETEVEVSSEPETPQREMTKEEIAREQKVLDAAEARLEALKAEVAEKEIIFNKLSLELKRMLYIFNKVKEIDINTAGKELNTDPDKVSY